MAITRISRRSFRENYHFEQLGRRGTAARSSAAAPAHGACVLVGRLLDGEGTVFAGRGRARSACPPARLGHQASSHRYRLESDRDRRGGVYGRSASRAQGPKGLSAGSREPRDNRLLRASAELKTLITFRQVESVRSWPNERAFRRHYFLPQRRHLFRQGHAACAVRAHGPSAGAGGWLLRRSFRKICSA